MVKAKVNPKTNEWEILEKWSSDPESLYFDGMLFDSFMNAKKIMKQKNIDLVVVCSGYPGLGKSKLVSQLACLCDPTFTEDRMWQKTEEFVEAVKNETEINKAHVLDEAWEGMSTVQMRSQIGAVLINLMNVIRQKRLYIFIVLPDFFDLSKNIAIFRSRWLIHCYAEQFGDVGRFAAFNQNSKKQLYIKGKRFEDYSAQPADFFGRFTGKDAPSFNWERYEKVIKPRALNDAFLVGETERVTKSSQQRDLVVALMHHLTNISPAKIVELTGITKTLVYDAIQKYSPQIKDKLNIDPLNQQEEKLLN